MKRSKKIKNGRILTKYATKIRINGFNLIVIHSISIFALFYEMF